MRKTFLAGFLVALAFNGCGPPRDFRDKLDRFTADAIRLCALTEQGVTNEKFGDQLATVNADFGLLIATWPRNYKAEARQQFDKAIAGWRLTYVVWNRKFEAASFFGSEHDELDVGTNEHLVAALRRYAPDKLQFLAPGDSSADSSLSYQRTVRALMTEASNHFAAGIAALKK